MSNTNDGYHEYQVAGDDLISRVREIIREGNARRLFLKKEDGETIVEVPLSAGVTVTAIGAMMAPALVAVGAVAAMFTSVTVGVERTSAAAATS